MMTQKKLICVVLFLFALIYSPHIAVAQPATCAWLTSLPPLAGNPDVKSATSAIIPPAVQTSLTVRSTSCTAPIRTKTSTFA